MFKVSKRLFDLFFSFVIIVLTIPILLLSILLIILIDLQKPFFVQERSGINGRKINIFKLQSMKTLNGSKKITKLGKYLRLTKIDELPQLFSVITNDMSLIGPRPLYLEFNKHYKKKHRIRVSIKPGLSGLAQVKVKDSTNWQMKFNFDTIYVNKANFKLECYILFRTAVIILKSIFIKKERSIESIDYMKNFFENYK